MAMSEYSLADIRAATEGHDGYCGDGWGMGGSWFAWIFLFALLGGGGWGGWGNRGGGPVTEADLCTTNSFNELKSQVGRMNDQQAAIARQTDNAICQIGYQNLQNTDLLERQIADCCCTTQRAIDSVKFDMANYSAATNANTTAVGQKILDKLSGMELAQKDAIIANQGQRIAALEADARMCGVVRYPTATTYATFCNPFFGFGGFNGNCGCGCNNI